MPLYDFECRDCGRVSEVLIRTSGQVAHCPECDSTNVERLISASYMIKTDVSGPGTTCCGRSERCEVPPCSTGDVCRRN
jgi:putative FmdB family regulatory protein